MRQGTNPRRGRGRGGGRHNNNTGNNNAGVPNKNQSFSSNGPNERVNGNPKTVYDKYCALAVEANRAHDRVLAETYYQHADHYYRIMFPYAPDQKPHSPAEAVAESGVKQPDSVQGGNGDPVSRKRTRRPNPPKAKAENGADAQSAPQADEPEDRSGVDRLVATPVKPRRNPRRKSATAEDSAAPVEAE